MHLLVELRVRVLVIRIPCAVQTQCFFVAKPYHRSFKRQSGVQGPLSTKNVQLAHKFT